MNYDCSRFQKGLQELKLDLSEEQIQQFLTFYEYLMEKNKVMNLTGITEFQEVVEKHFLDSLCLVKAFPPAGYRKKCWILAREPVFRGFR